MSVSTFFFGDVYYLLLITVYCPEPYSLLSIPIVSIVSTWGGVASGG